MGLPLIPSRAGNAADEYVKAIRSVTSRLDRLGADSFASYRSGLPLTEEEIGWIIEGSKRKDSAFSPSYYPIKQQDRDTEFHAVAGRAIAEGILEHAQALREHGRDRKATQLQQHLVVFGWHLKNERRSLLQHLVGVITECSAWDALRSFYLRQGMTEQAMACQTYVEQERTRFETVAQKRRLMAMDDHFARTVLQQDEAAMWRRYAVLFIGAHMEPLTTDLVSLLERVAREDPDESVREAAQPWVLRGQALVHAPVRS